ncbi:HET-domain-containing protein [Aspergillus eucalypticola CBS 122712]|uniref:HET-domain-containing protein n=1 Tax=Aspergillus eucalypticola (strain CBS 122712 / IBT 29274) TaxID=1448314 RepID=A0A317V4E9_ASPEC|nr:HET-domain-containing protein [Aspergillus eucalypticola CBS 122712]PWY68221.1 HET-domain-containing protein [Aspergillus eucalypticola CBS 122712]
MTDADMSQSLVLTMTQSQGLYHKLDPTLKQIRLVTIEPGKWTDDIQCTLRETSLADSEPYETLSYVWGDHTNTKNIIVNGSNFNATANLESALRHLRRYTPRTMWIDAICINQQDLGERASQVSIMRDIYHGSNMTVIWLGDGDERVESLFDLARRFYNQSYEDYRPAQRDQPLIREVRRTEDRRQTINFLITDILGRPWWTRAWVFQEAVVSAELLVKCGNHEITWLPLSWLAKVLFGSTYFTSFLDRVSIGKLEDVIKIQRTREAMEKGHEISLTQLLAWNKRQRSSDPRDKIFSLLGLARGGPGNAIHPDYSVNNTLLDVCLGLVVHSIRDWGGEPSLVKDFWNIPPSDYDASRSRSPEYRLLLDVPALKAVGIYVDTIDCLAVTYDPDKHGAWSSSRPDPWVALLTSYFENPSHIPELSSWIYALPKSETFMEMGESLSNEFQYQKSFVTMSIKLLKKIRESTTGRDYVGGGSLALAYLRTLMADTWAIGYRNGGMANPLYFDELIAIENEFTPSDEATEEDDTGYVIGKEFVKIYCYGVSVLNYAIERATSYRRLMISSKGYIGLVPPKTQEGDLVCVLFGCSVPVILRKQGSHYIFIGESYVHGIMDGEAIQMMNEGHLVEEEFTLV